jgi:3-deoxy-D-manno-octulosonic-acid transferase
LFLWFYNLCFPFVFLALLPGYLVRMFRRGDFRAHFGQRFGWYSRELRLRSAQSPPRLWLQAVSVGEMLTALKLVAALRAEVPGLPMILSTTTTTGFRLARERAEAGIEVVYSPIDLLPCMRRAFRGLRPAALVIVDGGLWPNQLAEARRLGVPTALVNARLSPRSERRFLRFRAVSASLFGLLDLVCVPEPTDVARWTRLGVPGERIRYTGSIKFDDCVTHGKVSEAPDRAHFGSVTPQVRQCLDDLGVTPPAPILLAGSTHAGEEVVIAETFLRLRETIPDLALIVAPRHVERTASVVSALRPLKVRVVRRTELSLASTSAAAGHESPSLPLVLLLDTTGELKDWYAAATLVFIGKSLKAVGGQNPAEAISAGRPVVVGPHMENFDELVRGLLDAGGIVQVPDAAGLFLACEQLLGDAARRERLAAAAYEHLQAHRGAARRSATLLLAQTEVSA